ncbi:phytoene/squalene synthase family protein [Luteolibacter sp. AS25]|uniref:phytoene/squalene synthase family protein n=1 Tax=Luteolibacter sp. AS25 TaxID=3135776 RepID=UPI00398B2EF1
MAGGLETEVLKAVSRSFYLSLKFLPQPMRRPASIAYLLARASDTIADTVGVPVEDRLKFLTDFEKEIELGVEGVAWPESFFSKIEDSGERELLRRHGEVLNALRTLPVAEQDLVREVLAIIVDGQRGDLKVFGEDGVRGAVVSLKNGDELEGYCWKVAGCVGVFWTKLGYETLGRKFSDEEPQVLLESAARYGRGLQLVNILRDLAEDLDDGRCYLPVSDSRDEAALMKEFEKWREIAMGYVQCGRGYAKYLKMRRLRMASSLPALIAEDTLGILKGASLTRLREGVKVPRSRVYSHLLTAFFSG